MFFILLIKFDSLNGAVTAKAKNLQCEDKCISSPTDEAVCLRKAKTNLTLVCEKHSLVNFVRNNDNKTISGFNVQFFSDNNSYSQINNVYNELVINSLRGIDSGKRSFRGYDVLAKLDPCNYSIYTYGML
jgi:hypothetical protein